VPAHVPNGVHCAGSSLAPCLAVGSQPMRYCLFLAERVSLRRMAEWLQRKASLVESDLQLEKFCYSRALNQLEVAIDDYRLGLSRRG
jgi:hypothetical protein